MNKFCVECGKSLTEQFKYCPICGASSADLDRSSRAGVASAQTSNPAGRRLGEVLVGAMFGLLLGLFGVLALLVFTPKEQRGDKVFGAWLGVITGAIALTAGGALVLMQTNASSLGTDQVVGAVIKCETGRVEDPIEHTGRQCLEKCERATLPQPTAAPGSTVITYCGVPTYRNVRKVITVRSQQGSTYEIELEATAKASIGSAWPPE